MAFQLTNVRGFAKKKELYGSENPYNSVKEASIYQNETFKPSFHF